ncbi:MAG: ATP-binding protein [Bacteroidota bacterium]
MASIIFFNSHTVFTEQLIYTSSLETEKQLNEFLNPVSENLQKISRDGMNGKYSLEGETSLNNYFIPLLESSSNISSVKYFDVSGQQYLLYKDKNTFVSTYRIEKTFNNEVIWKRWENVNKQISEWKQNIDKNPARQNWAKYFHSETKHDSIYWLRLKGFGDVSIGEITAVTFGNIDQTETLFGCGLGIKINNLTESLTELRHYSNPKLFLINSRNHIIPLLMDYEISDSEPEGVFTFENLSDSLVISFLSNWKELGSEPNSTFTLEYNDEKWWGQVDPFELNKSSMKLGVAISESELIYASLFNTYLIIVILFLLLIIVSILYFRRKRKKIQLGERLTEEELKQMLAEGESKHFELKSSLRWDYREEKVNKKLEEVIIKSVSAFNNSEGGYLIIGIDDDKKILGLNNDYTSLKKNDADYFELHLRNLLGSSFTIRYTARKIDISFIVIENKEICVIKIAKGEYPLFLKTTDKNGKQLEKFYIRSGNSSQEITSLSEINNYINVRFKEEK